MGNWDAALDAVNKRLALDPNNEAAKLRQSELSKRQIRTAAAARAAAAQRDGKTASNAALKPGDAVKPADPSHRRSNAVEVSASRARRRACACGAYLVTVSALFTAVLQRTHALQQERVVTLMVRDRLRDDVVMAQLESEADALEASGAHVRRRRLLTH